MVPHPPITRPTNHPPHRLSHGQQHALPPSSRCCNGISEQRYLFGTLRLSRSDADEVLDPPPHFSGISVIRSRRCVDGEGGMVVVVEIMMVGVRMLCEERSWPGEKVRRLSQAAAALPRTTIPTSPSLLQNLASRSPGRGILLEPQEARDGREIRSGSKTRS